MIHQEIVERMTKGVWRANGSTYNSSEGRVKGVDILVEDWNNHIKPIKNYVLGFIPQNEVGIQNSTGESLDTCEANAYAIAAAVNNTYGKGFDPEKIVSELERLRRENAEMKTKLDAIKKALNP